MKALSFFLTATLAFAQGGSSTIGGRVTDSTDAIIPRAAVKVINEESGIAASAITNEAGLYRVATLLPGTYRIEIEAGGFQRSVRQGVVVQVSQTLQIDQALTVGNVTETVAVTSRTPAVETQSSHVSQLVERSVIEGMPLPNRSAAAMVVLSPGATVIDPGSGGENLPIFSVGGGRARNQQFSLDGGNVTNITGLAVPQNQAALPMEAMQEFRVITNNYAAEFGHSAGGVVTMSTRSGTNDFHGSVFEYLRNNALDARNFFAVTKAPLRLNQFGAAVGGPIRKDKTHFFASWEQTRQVTGGTSIQTVPNASNRAGDFSNVLDATGRLIPIFDPATTQNRVRQPFPGNVIPANRIDPVARAAAAFYPDPNRAATITGANNFGANTRPAFDRDILVARVDHQFRPADQVTLRYYVNDNESENPGVWRKPEADPSATIGGNNNSSWLASHTHLFTPQLINDFRVTRLRRFGGTTAAVLGTNLAQKLGLTGVSDQAFPIFNITAYATLGREPFRRNNRPSDDMQYQNSVSWFRGKHAWKFGGEYRRGYFNDDRDLFSSGQFGFTPLMTGQPGVANSGNAFASFLLGEVNSAGTQRPDIINSRSAYWALYLQEDYRLTDRLTVNYGMRWELNLPRTEDNNLMNAFDTSAINPISRTPGVVRFASRDGEPRTAFDSDKNNYGPRAGFAWRMPGKKTTVFRAGGGIFFGEIVSNIIGTAAALGFSTDVDLISSQPGIVSAMVLRNGFPSVPRVPVDQLGAGFGAVPVGQSPAAAPSFFERSRPTPYSIQYNANVQRELAANLLFEAGYIANISHKLTANDFTLNQIRIEDAAPGNAQVRRPFPQFSNVTVINPPIGNSTYHAFTVKGERRYSSGLTFLAHYTFSKFIDDVQSFSEFGNPGGYMDFYNRRLDKGLSGNDVPHRTLASAVYALPGYQRRWLQWVAGGWRTGLIASMQSGAPFTVFNNTNDTNVFAAGTIRANVAGTPALAEEERTLSRWFNTAAFAAPAPFRFGNSPRSVLRGPNIANIDLSLGKSFSITERWKTEFRGEFYNLLNHTNFGQPGPTRGTPAFGVISSAREARRIQLALRVTF
ncbi:MAG: carboxypeptidase regulatory-like domain-containing protein [Bryobacteraceae bacterium]